MLRPKPCQPTRILKFPDNRDCREPECYFCYVLDLLSATRTMHDQSQHDKDHPVDGGSFPSDLALVAAIAATRGAGLRRSDFMQMADAAFAVAVEISASE